MKLLPGGITRVLVIEGNGHRAVCEIHPDRHIPPGIYQCEVQEADFGKPLMKMAAQRGEPTLTLVEN